MSSWHLYPNLQVLGHQVKEVDQNDPLMKGALLTVSALGNCEPGKEGVYWSLPLSRMKYHAPTVRAERHLGSDASRISFEDFQMVILGSIIGPWSISVADSCRFIILLQRALTRQSLEVEWFNLLANAVGIFERSTGTRRELFSKLISLGARQGRAFLRHNATNDQDVAVFGMADYGVFFDMLSSFRNYEPTVAISTMRRIVRGLSHLGNCFIIRYRIEEIHLQTDDSSDAEESAGVDRFLDYGFASAFPLASPWWRKSSEETTKHHRWCIDRSHSNKMQLAFWKERLRPTCTTRPTCKCPDCATRRNAAMSALVQRSGEHFTLVNPESVVSDLGGKLELHNFPDKGSTIYEFALGSLHTAALYERIDPREPDLRKADALSPIASLDLLRELLECGSIEAEVIHCQLNKWATDSGLIDSLKALVWIASIYDDLDDATVNLQSIKVPLDQAFWFIRRKECNSWYRKFACIAMLETGGLNIDPQYLTGVFAMSVGDSIFAPETLLTDPASWGSARRIRRVFGNVGKSGVAFITNPIEAKLKEFDPGAWAVINHAPFNGQLEDCFRGTSLHLTFTEYEQALDIGTRGMRDVEAFLMEAVVSIDDRGRTIGELNFAIDSPKLKIHPDGRCVHSTNSDPISSHQEEAQSVKHCHEGLVTLDSWEEFLDPPKQTAIAIARSTGNWQAKLAMSIASVQQGYEAAVLPERPCLKCINLALKSLERSNSEAFKIIIA